MPMKGGSGGGGKDVRAGGAFVEIFGKDNLTGLLKKMQARVAAFGKFLNDAAGAAGKAGLALAVPLTALFAGGLNRAAEVDRLAESFGMSAEQMSRLAHAAEVAGVSIEEVVANQSKFASLIANAPTIDGDTARAATIAQREFRASLIALQSALVPLLKPFTTMMTIIGQFARQNANVVQVVAAVALGLLAFAGAAKIAALGMFGLSAAFGVAAVAVKAFFALLAIAASPIGIVAAALAGLGYLFIRHTETGREFGEAAKSAFGGVLASATRVFRDIGAIFGTTFGGILDAFRGGDLELAAQIGLQGLRTLWARTVLFLTEVWVGFKATFVDTWHDLTAGVELAWEQTTSAVAQGIISISEFMVVTFLSAVERMTGAASDLASAVGLDDLASGLKYLSSQVGSLREGTQAFSGDMRKAIDDDLRASESAIGKELAIRKDANAKFRESQVANAKSALAEELAALDTLRQRAAAIAVGAGQGRAALNIMQRPDLFSGLSSRDDLFRQARGGFASGSSSGQFALGDKSDSRIDLRNIAKNTGKMAAETSQVLLQLKNMEDKLGIVVGN